MGFADEIYEKLLDFFFWRLILKFYWRGFVILFLFCFATDEKRAVALLLHAGEKYKQTEFPTEKKEISEN